MSKSGSRSIGPFVQGLVGAVALGSMSSAAGGQTQNAVTLAMGFGLLAAVLAVAGWLSWWAGFFYSALGVVAFLAAGIAFVQADGCVGLPPSGFRVVTLALLIVVAGISLLAGFLWLGKGLSPALGLGVFGALEILITASMFVTSARSGAEWLAMALLIPGAAALGWFAGRATDIVLSVAGVAVGMQSIYSAALGSNCGIVNYSGAVLIVGFCVTYFVTRKVVGLFTFGR